MRQRKIIAWYFLYFYSCQAYQCLRGLVIPSRVCDLHSYVSLCHGERNGMFKRERNLTSDEGIEKTVPCFWPRSDSPWARQDAGNRHRATEFTRAATRLRNLWGSSAVINKSGWGSPSGSNIFQQNLLTWCLVGFINILSPSARCELCFTLPHPSPLSVCLLLSVKSRLCFALFVPERLPPTFSLLAVSVQTQNTENHMWNRILLASQRRWTTKKGNSGRCGLRWNCDISL